MTPIHYERREVDNLVLYYFPSCPYCRIVIRQINKLNLGIEFRDIHKKAQYKQELINGGGKKTVPCLRIQDSETAEYWMYESLDIITYLKKRFA